MSQEELASRLTVSRQAISKWELGESTPDTENIIQLTRIFSVSADYLLNDEVDIPIRASVGEDAGQDTGYKILEKELKNLPDDERRMVIESYQSQTSFRNNYKLFFYLLEILGGCALIGFIIFLIFFL